MPDDLIPPSSSPPLSPSPSPGPAPAAPAASAAPAGSPSSPTPTAAAPQRPDWAPDRYWDTTTNQLKGTDLRKDFDSLAAFKAAEDSRKLTLPQAPDQYKVGTTKNFKAPEGVEFKLDEADPSWGAAKSWAHKHGITQDALHEITDVFAGYVVGDAQRMKTAASGEIAKLGGAGAARVDAVTQWLTAMGGDKFAGLNKVLALAPLASTVEGLEHLMQQFTTQGGGSYGGGKRDGGDEPGKIPGYANMTFDQKRAAQDRMNSNRRAG